MALVNDTHWPWPTLYMRSRRSCSRSCRCSLYVIVAPVVCSPLQNALQVRGLVSLSASVFTQCVLSDSPVRNRRPGALLFQTEQTSRGLVSLSASVCSVCFCLTRLYVVITPVFCSSKQSKLEGVWCLSRLLFAQSVLSDSPVRGHHPSFLLFQTERTSRGLVSLSASVCSVCFVCLACTWSSPQFSALPNRANFKGSGVSLSFCCCSVCFV